FIYDTAIFNTLIPFTGASTKNLTAVQAGELTIAGGVLSQSPGSNGFSVTLTDSVLSGTLHYGTVNVSNNRNTANEVTGSTGGVIFGITLHAKTTENSSNIYLYNSVIDGRTDVIGIPSSKGGGTYVLNLPTSLTYTTT